MAKNKQLAEPSKDSLITDIINALDARVTDESMHGSKLIERGLERMRVPELEALLYVLTEEPDPGSVTN